MAKINKVINVKVEGVGKIKQLEDSLKKLRKQQRDIKKDMKEGANAGKYAEQQYKKNEQAVKNQSKALRETKKAMVDANNTTRKGTRLQNSMAMGVIKGAAAFSILVTAFRRVSDALTTLIGTFTEFEFTMAKVKAVSGANAEEFKKLSDSAQELGRSTFFTASEVANLQLNLSKLGFTTPEILAATEATINLSIATGSDLARSATVAGNAVRGFQLDATETGRVVDVMAVAFTSSALDIEKWQTSMTKVAPIATMAGFSIEETTAIMAKLSDTGIEASIAGTSLRNIFLKMQDPTSELTRKVGHTIHSLDDMLKIFKDMQAEGTDLADVLTFMDVRQVAAFGTMLEGADDIQVLVEQLENADGAGQRMADTVGDTLQGGIFRVKSALQGLSIAIVTKFGGALKKNLVKFADWLNKIVSTEGALEKIGNKIKWVTRILLGYLIQVKASVVWSKLAGSAFFTMATGAQRASTMVRMLNVSLKAFRVALLKTGVGVLVVLLGELAAWWMTSSDAAEKYISTEDKVREGMEDTLLEVEKVKETLKSLKKTREKINKINDDSVLSQEKLKILRKQEKSDIDTINGHLKTYNQELITQKDNIDDITLATKSLITAMKDKALAQIFTDLTAEILKAKVGADVIENQMDDYLRNQDTGVGDSYASKSISDIAKDVKEGYRDFDYDPFALSGERKRYKHKERLKGLLEEYGMTIDDFIEASKRGYYDSKVKEVKKVIEGLTSTSLVDLLSPPSGDDDGGPESQPYKKTLEEMTAEFLTEIDRTVSAVDLKVAELEAKRDAIAKFLKQKGVKGSEAEPRAKLQQQKVLAALEDAYYAQSLDKLKRELDEEKNTLKASDDFKALTTAEQNVKLGELDTQFYEDKKTALLLHNQEMDAIESKIAQDNLAKEALDLEAADDKLTKQYEVDKLNLDLALANEQITEIQHKEFMLHLEAMYLAQKAEMYAGHGEALATINNQIKTNDIKTTEQLMDSMNSYIGKIGELGGHMTDLAGDEEKLSGLRKAGIIITKVAATAESILAIATTVTTLATKRKTVAEAIDVSMTGAVISANIAKTASNVATAASGFLSTMSSAAASLPFPFNLIAIAATLLAIRGAIRSVKGMFKSDDTPTVSSGTGTSSSDSSSSSGGGGGSSSSGAMTYYTYGGRHSTYADGGMVYGNSHARGGEKFAVGGRVVELEGGEAVINKRSTSMFRSQLSAMNSAGGGAKFADGGITNNPSFAKTQFDVMNQSSNGGTSRVVVVEADITSSQNTVKTIESEASF